MPKTDDSPWPWRRFKRHGDRSAVGSLWLPDQRWGDLSGELSVALEAVRHRSAHLAAASEISQNQNRSLLTYPSPAQTAGSAVGQQASELGAQITRRNLNVQPTIKIPVGYRFNVRVNRDILFDAPYAPMSALH